MTTENFIKKLKNIYGDKYDYSKVEYVNQETNVCIICQKHGEFYRTPKSLINKRECVKCTRKGRLSIGEFIEKANLKHNNKYDYSNVEYVNNKTKVCIICPEHGEFFTIPLLHLSGCECPKCCGHFLDKDFFIEKAKLIHDNIYDYSKVEYVNAKTKVCIICPIHGEFYQTPNQHLQERGCPKCATKRNKSENKFLKLLENNFKGEEIIYQYRNKEMLGRQSIDFYFPKYKIAIEYQGRQHFVVTHFSSNKDENIKKYYNYIKNDKLKYEKCIKHNINILYFTYENSKYIPSSLTDRIFIKENEIINKIKSLIK